MIYLAADHRGFRLKEELKKMLERDIYDCRDLGAFEYDKDDDYPKISINLAKAVTKDKVKGILVCGSGTGASIAANKVCGARAGLCTSVRQAQASRNDDDINILCLSADWISFEDNENIVKTFINTLFSGEERHIRRIEQINDYESKKCK